MYKIYCRLRDAKGVKDADVARETKIIKSTFTDWKNGRSTPKIDKLQKIADYFGVTTDYLMGNEDDETQSAEIDKALRETISKLGSNDSLLFCGMEMDDETKVLLRNSLESTLATIQTIQNAKKK